MHLLQTLLTDFKPDFLYQTENQVSFIVQAKMPWRHREGWGRGGGIFRALLFPKRWH